MERKLKNLNQSLSEKETWEILENSFYGILSTIAENGTPYGIPLNHVLSDNKLYFHSGLKGHKLDNISQHEKVSFTVVKEIKMLPKKYTAQFKSIIAFGTIKKLGTAEEITKALYLLCKKT